MFVYEFTFRSFTAAQGGRGVLQQAGIGCELLRAPRSLSDQGCGYVLRVQAQEGMAAAQALRAWHVSFVQLYRCFPNGVCQEAEL